MKSKLQVLRGLCRVFPILGAGIAIAAGQTTTAVNAPATDQKVVEMSPFNVSATQDYGYRKTMSTTTSRIALPAVENPQSVEIISGDLLKDFGVSMPYQAFRYSSTVIVGENEVGQAGLYKLRGFQAPVYYNGVGQAGSFSLTPYFVTDNVDRIEVAKGPVALFFGNSTPNGVINYITKKPEFKQATALELTFGSFRFSKAMFDTQSVLSPEYGLAWRMISSFTDNWSRIKGAHDTITMVDPSFIWRPNNKVQVTAELDWEKQKMSYATFAWNLALNPQYYQDVLNPTADFVNFIQQYYGLASTAAARAKMNDRWGFPSLGTDLNTVAVAPQTVQGTYTQNWAIDRWNYTGVQPAYLTGSTIDWWRYGATRDDYAVVGPGSNFNGYCSMANASVTLTPIDNLSIKYNWQRITNSTAFTRQLILPDAGLRPDGRVIYMNQIAANSWTPNRYGMSDAQQVDVSYTFNAAGMKHNLVAGYEWDRSFATIDNVTINGNLANNTIDSYTLPGNVLKQQYAALYWDPFSGTPLTPLYQFVASAPKLTNISVSNFKAYYISYRGSALDNKLNVVVGARNTTVLNTMRKANTPTYGAIYEVVPGFHVFASASQSVTLSAQMSASGPGLLPSDNAHLLDNEKDKGTEIGIKSDWKNETLSGTLSYYSDERSGVITSEANKYINDPRNQGVNLVNTQVNFYTNGGVQKAEGLDGDLTWTPNRQFQMVLNGQWEFTSKIVSDPSLSPLTPGDWSHIHELHYRLSKSPLYKGNLVVRYTIGSGMFRNLTLGGAVRYSGIYLVSDGNSILITVPTETLFDCFLDYQTKIGNLPTSFKLTGLNLGNTINDITRSNGFETRLTVGFKF